jgi:hypothetical protein
MRGREGLRTGGERERARHGWIEVEGERARNCGREIWREWEENGERGKEERRQTERGGWGEGWGERKRERRRTGWPMKTVQWAGTRGLSPATRPKTRREPTMATGTTAMPACIASSSPPCGWRLSLSLPPPPPSLASLLLHPLPLPLSSLCLCIYLSLRKQWPRKWAWERRVERARERERRRDHGGREGGRFTEGGGRWEGGKGRGNKLEGGK